MTNILIFCLISEWRKLIAVGNAFSNVGLWELR
jgi:hypothetical protein